MSQIKISKKYISKVLHPLKKTSKIVPSVLLFKDQEKDEVVINTSDSNGTCWVGIKTGRDNMSFEGECMGILDLNDFAMYTDLIGYGKDESASMERVEAHTRRGSRHDCIEMHGKIGKFVMPVAREESFEQRNRKIQKDQGEPIDGSAERVCSFKLSREDLKELSDIGKSLAVTRLTISVKEGSIILFIKGRGNNQYTKIIGEESIKMETIELDNGSSGYFYEEENYDEYLSFMFQIFDLANMFAEDFVFEIRRNGSLYSLQAYGSTAPDVPGESEEERNVTSDIRYVLFTSISPENALNGNTEGDVFEQ